MGSLAVAQKGLAFLVALCCLAAPWFSPEAGGAVEAFDRIQYASWELVTALAWSPDGQFLAVSAGTTLHLYDSVAGDELSSHNLGVYTHSLVFSPGGEWLAAGSRDGQIRLWKVEKTGDELSLSPDPGLSIDAHSKGVNTLDFNQAGDLLVSGGNDAMARVWDFRTGDLRSEIIGGTFTVPAVSFLHKSDLLAVVNGNDIRLRDPLSRSIGGSFKAGQVLFSLAVSQDDQFLALGDTENGVQVWRISDAYRSGMLQYPEPIFKTSHAGKAGTYRTLVWDVAFSPDGLILASAGGDGEIVLWSAADGQRLMRFDDHQAGVTCLAFSPDGKWLASGSLDASVRFWRVK